MELASAGLCQPVKPGAPVGLRFAPAGFEPTRLFHPVQSGKQGAGFNLKGSIGGPVLSGALFPFRASVRVQELSKSANRGFLAEGQIERKPYGLLQRKRC
jgi:hypothetical protein